MNPILVNDANFQNLFNDKFVSAFTHDSKSAFHPQSTRTVEVITYKSQLEFIVQILRSQHHADAQGDKRTFKVYSVNQFGIVECTDDLYRIVDRIRLAVFARQKENDREEAMVLLDHCQVPFYRCIIAPVMSPLLASLGFAANEKNGILKIGRAAKL